MTLGHTVVAYRNQRLYRYLYSGNYQFAAIHYGVREGFADLRTLAATHASRLNRISPLVLPLRRAARIYSTRLLDSPPLDRVVKFNYREIKRELRNLYLEMEKESEMISN